MLNFLLKYHLGKMFWKVLGDIEELKIIDKVSCHQVKANTSKLTMLKAPLDLSSQV